MTAVSANETLQTRVSLLLRLRDAEDHDAWELFVRIYAGMLHQFFCRRGVQDADAADLVQNVLQGIADSIDGFQYDPNRGSFRSWLYRIARNKLADFLKQKQRRALDGHSGILRSAKAPEADEELWEQDYQRQLFAAAAEWVRQRVQSSSWAAFQRTAIDGEPAQTTAEQLGMSVGAVYVARSRILARIKAKALELREAPL